MAGRTMYVLPFSMGDVGSPMSQIGVQLTDSPYVVVSMRIMARIGLPVFARDRPRQSSASCRACTASARRSRRGRRTCPGRATRRSTSSTFPETREIWSYGSGYGGNALLGKKCFALRIASNIARDEGWMAEHMLILGVEDPHGEKTYVAAAFPSACGKTNFAMLIPPDGMKGWKVWTVGDDIAWIKPDANGRLRAINPEAGFFGVAPGTSQQDQSERDGDARAEHDLHERRAHARRRRVVGRHDGRAAGRVPRLAGRPVDAGDRPRDRRRRPRIRTRASPRRRRSARSSIPTGRNPKACRSAPSSSAAAARTTMPLVYQAFNWTSGVYIGATMGSETTAAAAGSVGKVRRDPMAMLPFCGYHMGDYFRHWIKMQRLLSETPKIFHVNWFRKDADGPVPLAGLPREHARAEVDRRSRARPRAGDARRRSAGCRATRTSTGRGLDFLEGAVRGAAERRSARVAPRSDRSTRSCSSTCTTTCRRRWSTSANC